MSARPSVSVLIPCYNLGAYLEEAVDSVVAQTVRDVEILIVDDGSTDHTTIRLLDDFERSRTLVFRTANRGLAAARNYLIERARGEYLCALDADDRLHPRFLEKTLAAFDADPGLAFVSTHLRMFGDETHVWPSDARCDLARLLNEDTVMTAALVRRSAALAVGGYDERMPAQGDEDWDLWISLVAAGHRGIILPDTLFYYRRRPGSMCTQCTAGDTHLGLLQYLVRKHRVSYERHLADVLAAKDAALGHVETQIAKLHEELGSVVAPIDVEARWQTRPADEPVERAILTREARLLTLREIESALRGQRAAARQQSVKPARGLIEMGSPGQTTPVSERWGVDRGRPIDRYYIEQFLERHAADVRGHVLEIKDSHYTRRYGGYRVVAADVMDIDPSNPLATVVADLSSAGAVSSNWVDCFILTQTLGLIFDVRAAIAEAVRILKPGGVLLCTLPAAGRISPEGPGRDGDYWRFTEASVRQLFSSVAPEAAFEITGYGNVLAGSVFLYGYAVEEVDPADLDVFDPYFPLVYSVRLVKPYGDTTTVGEPRAGHVVVADATPDADWLRRACLQIELSPQLDFVASHAAEWQPADAGDRFDLVGVLADSNIVGGPAVFRQAALDAIGGLDPMLSDERLRAWSAIVSLLARGRSGSVLPYPHRTIAAPPTDPTRAAARSREMWRAHNELYRANALAVVLRKQIHIRRLLDDNYEMEAEISSTAHD